MKMSHALDLLASDVTCIHATSSIQPSHSSMIPFCPSYRPSPYLAAAISGPHDRPNSSQTSASPAQGSTPRHLQVHRVLVISPAAVIAMSDTRKSSSLRVSFPLHRVDW
jgi:hypothetical protein